MSIESLKQQARRHEQNEEWQKALDQYKKAISALTQDDQTDIGLINRVGDLFVRVGKLDEAVKHYEQAVDLYREAFLPNNAIAVCKKIIRNVPDLPQPYLKIGQIRAEQGFLPDARTNFLTYAERMQQAGDLDESFRALVEFCDLAPDDVDVRITVAEQMAAQERTEEAVEQLVIAYSRLTQAGDTGKATEVEDRIQKLDPSVDVGAAAAGMGGDDEQGGFGEIDLGEPAPARVRDEEAEIDFGGSDEFEITSDSAAAALEDAAEEEAELPMMSLGGDDEDEEEAAELPMMGFGDEDEDEDEEEAPELPMMGFEDEDEDEAAELPTMDLAGDDDEDEDEAAELPTMDLAGDDDEEDAVELPTMDFDDEDGEGETTELPTMDVGGLTLAEEAPAEPDRPDLASESLEEAVEEAAPAAQEAPAPEAPAEPAKADSGGDYVDFGAMILGSGPKEAKTTRFQVAYEEPSGDEEADFAKMLSQFKEKVSENLEAGDVRAHYDLGTAYKEMGLLEEAISSFQQALRASADHLPTYEQMGQTFLEMGQPEAAVRTLERALKSKSTVEDEFLGIYYYLARAFEELDNKTSAVEYYDRVFALDINFADVTERLRELR